MTCRLGDAVAVVLAVLLLGASIWTVVPAPVLPLLVLAVVAPEVPGWTLAACAIFAIAVAFLARGRSRRIAFGLVTAAVVCAALPLAALPGKLADLAAALPPSSRVVAELPFVAGELAAPFATAPHAPREFVWSAYPGAPAALVFEPVLRFMATDRRFAVVLVHGGAWRFGSWRDERELGRRLASLGYVAIAPDYALVPAARFPVAAGQIARTVDAVAASPAVLGIDPGHVALVGQSAGAELVLLAAQRRMGVRPCATVGYFAPTDLLGGYERPPVPDPADVRAILRAYIGGTPATARDAYVAASPALGVRSQLAPTLLLTGSADEVVAPHFQAEMTAALRAQGDPVIALQLAFANHAFDAVPDGIDGRLARAAVERFLGREFQACGRRPAPRPERGPGGRPSDE